MFKFGTLLLTIFLLAFTALTFSAPGTPIHQSAYVEPGLKTSRSSTLSVIVTAEDESLAARGVREIGGNVSTNLWLIDGVVATIPTSKIDALAKFPGIQTIVENKPVHTAETYPIDTPYIEDGWVTERRVRLYQADAAFAGILAAPPAALPDGGAFALLETGECIIMNADGSVRDTFSLTDSSFNSPPVVGSDGTIYLVGETYAFAINPDGSIKWDQSTWDEFAPGIGLYESGALLYTISGDYRGVNILGLNTANGEIAFTTALEPWRSISDFQSPPTVNSDGFAYIVNHDGLLYKLEPSGEINWVIQLPGTPPFELSPQIGLDGTVYIPSRDGWITAVDPQNGAQVYTFYRENGIILEPVAIAPNGSVYAAFGNSHVYAIDSTGNEVFDFEQADKSFKTSPVLSLDGNQVIVTAEQKVLYALDADTGTLNWLFNTYLPADIYDNPFISPSGNIHFGDDKGRYHILNPDGLLLYSYLDFGPFQQTPILSPSGTVFFQDANSQMVALVRLPTEWDEVTPDTQPTTDPTIYRVLDPITIDMGADILHENGVDGTGVGIAVVDSGVYFDAETHTYLGDAVQEHFLGQIDFVVDETECLTNAGTWHPTDAYCETDFSNSSDGYGHGSHVAGIIWNHMTDYNTGVTLGVAPDANILSVRVLGDNGGGSYADVIQGIQYVVDQKDVYSPTLRVINLSLTAIPTSPYFADPLTMAAEEAWAAGIVVLAAAGNVGPEAETITVPGNSPYVITVGAVDSQRTPGYWVDDDVAAWSATGPTYDSFLKPDVLAPGANVVSFMHNGDGEIPYLVKIHPDYSENTSLFRMNGTSMSTAAASGIAALMLEHDPSLTPDQVKFRMIYTGHQIANVDDGHVEVIHNIFQQGAGRIWAPSAVYGDLPVDGLSNTGMDILADLAHGWDTPEEIVFHYEGPVRKILSDDGGVYLYFVDAGDGTGMALGAADVATGLWLNADDLDDLAELQSGSELVWTSGQMVWAGGQMAWAGGQMVWAGGQMAWAGGQMAWAGGQMAWAGGQMVWTGGQWVDGDSFTWGPEDIDSPSALDDDWSEGELVWSGSQTDWLGGEMVWEPGLKIWDGGHIDTEETDIHPEPWVNDDGSVDLPYRTFFPLIIH